MSTSIEKKNWTIRVHSSFLSGNRHPISDQALVVFLVLELAASSDGFCWPGNTTIRKMTGKSDSALRAIFKELEDKGYITRTYSDDTRKERIGFILHKRTHPESTIIENNAESIALGTRAIQDAITAENRRQGSGKEVARQRKTGVSDSGKQATRDSGKQAAYKEDSSYKETTTTTESSSSSLSRGERNLKASLDPIIVEKLKKLWPDDQSVKAKSMNACREYGADEFSKAISVAMDHVAKTGKSVGWGYVLGILKNGQAEGGIVGPSVANLETRAINSPGGYVVSREERERIKAENDYLLNYGKAAH